MGQEVPPGIDWMVTRMRSNCMDNFDTRENVFASQPGLRLGDLVLLHRIHIRLPIVIGYRAPCSTFPLTWEPWRNRQPHTVR